MARKKTTETAPDAFQQEGLHVLDWFEANWKLFAAGVVVVLLGVIGLEFVQNSQRHGASLVTEDLLAAVETYQDATDLRKVLTSTSATQLAADYQKAEAQLNKFVEEHPDTQAARMASLYQGDLLARLEKPGEAEQKFQAYVSASEPEDDLLFFALEGLGYAQEAQNKLDEAAKTFEQLATTQPFYRDYGLKHKARILEEKGDKAGAVAAYQSIVDMDPASPLKPYAETRLKALQ